jgi:hypothetical protein
METMLTEVAQQVRQLRTDVRDIHGRLGGVEDRLGRVEGRLDGVENRLSGVETRVTSIEGYVKNIDVRTANIAEILPTLATKEDLWQGLQNLEGSLNTRIGGVVSSPGARIEDARRETRMLFEDVRGDIRMLAEHVVRLANRRGPDA